MKFTTSLTKCFTITLHRNSGQIGFFAQKWGDHFRYENPVNRFPWDYIEPSDCERVRAFFTAVASGIVKGSCRYTLDSATIGAADTWICETYWHPIPSVEFPVLGTSESWNAVVESLSPRERQVARLLATETVKEISFALKLTVSTVDTIRHRIGEKVDLLGPALIAWCQAHVDVL